MYKTRKFLKLIPKKKQVGEFPHSPQKKKEVPESHCSYTSVDCGG
jgi:hypothetical protein